MRKRTRRQPSNSEDLLGGHEKRLRTLEGSDKRLIGAKAITAKLVGTSVVISWRSNAGETVNAFYEIWRADGGTRSSPITASSRNAILIGVLPVIQSATRASEVYSWTDREFTIPQIDPADPTKFYYWVSMRDRLNRRIAKLPASGSPIEIIPNAPGDTSPEIKYSTLNKLNNAAILGSVPASSSDIPVASAIPPALLVSGATNATPIVITTTSNHGMATGDKVQITSVGGNTAANGYWTITNVTATTFILNGSVGNGAFSASGFAYQAVEQPVPQGVLSIPPSNLTPEWTVWHNQGVGTPDIVNPFLENSGTQNKGTFLFNLNTAVAPKSSTVFQRIDAAKFSRDMPLTFSAYIQRSSGPISSSFSVLLRVDQLNVLTVVSNFNGGFNGTLFTALYKRFVLVFKLSDVTFTHVRVRLEASLNSGTGTANDVVRVTAPMLNVGEAPAQYTAQADLASVTGILLPYPTWSRTIQQEMVRHPSAPYI